MKDLIKKILKEETSDLKPALIRAFYSFMEMEGYNIYVDTPEKRFYEPESIWIINPITERWMIELKKSGELWHSHYIYNDFSKWFNVEDSVFEQLITIWVEDVLKREVLTARRFVHPRFTKVDDVLNIGIKIS
jgi:hypothetical protein